MKKVLLVDDEKNILEVLTIFLERAGFDVKTLPSGDEVKDHLDKQHFDILITDLIMPGTSGIEIIKSTRQRYKDMIIVAMTGGARTELKSQDEEAFKAGANLCIYKPFKGSEFIKKLNELIAK